MSHETFGEKTEKRRISIANCECCVITNPHCFPVKTNRKVCPVFILDNGRGNVFYQGVLYSPLSDRRSLIPIEQYIQTKRVSLTKKANEVLKQRGRSNACVEDIKNERLGGGRGYYKIATYDGYGGNPEIERSKRIRNLERRQKKADKNYDRALKKFKEEYSEYHSIMCEILDMSSMLEAHPSKKNMIRIINQEANNPFGIEEQKTK